MAIYTEHGKRVRFFHFQCDFPLFFLLLRPTVLQKIVNMDFMAISPCEEEHQFTSLPLFAQAIAFNVLGLHM